MAKKRNSIWRADWFTGLMFALLFFVLAHGLARSFFYGLETAAYDRGVQLAHSTPSEAISVVAIDDKSIDNIGRWPWSRDVLAAVIDQLSAGGAKIITSTIFLSEQQLDPGLDKLRELNEFVGASASPDSQALRERIVAAMKEIDYDALLADSLSESGNVLLPIDFKIGRPLGNPDSPVPDFVSANRLENTGGISTRAIPAVPSYDITPPIAHFGRRALGLGHLNQILDIDGHARFEPLVIEHFGDLYPSLALATAARSLNLDLGDIEVLPEKGVRLGNLEILTTPELRMYNYFYGPRGSLPAFSVDSFFDVFTGQVPADKFRNKIVLIGAHATGVGDSFGTPVDGAMPPVLILAHTVSSILQADFFTRPSWAGPTELIVFALIAVYLIAVLPRLSAGWAALVSGAIGLALIGTEIGLLANRSMWIQLIIPLVLLMGGHLLMTVKRFGVTERLKIRSDEVSAESNRMLGLAFQNQGQLDIALEKFRQCPLDDSMMDPLYNLALDYERKRQFNKAGAIYSYMSGFDPHYKDLSKRLKRSQSMEETMILGAADPARTMMLDDGEVQKPILGRYTIEKEIGRGAMGTVYLGRDPKINRVVAIKTIALTQEFEDEDLSQARDRFFREAETAGRLNHPDIVTVYDAGEEHDLAYIAMEFLKGDHLSGYTRSDNLLPVNMVIDLMARAADALHYAHQQAVVHRDIKPANIMYDTDKNDLKITDFGIARITSSSKTKTGIVLGTPSYMSPEQLAGKNVTGRSDLFSLGVTLFQLLSGQLPFRADSMATLMYKIANEAHTPIKAVRPELPACIEVVVDRSLAKDPQKRYESGAAMAHDLRDCIQHLAA